MLKKRIKSVITICLSIQIYVNFHKHFSVVSMICPLLSKLSLTDHRASIFECALRLWDLRII